MSPKYFNHENITTTIKVEIFVIFYLLILRKGMANLSLALLCLELATGLAVELVGQISENRKHG